MRAAAQPHRFVGINQAGQVALLQTQGNPDGHVILRGGKAPNYSPADVAQCEKEMEQAGLRPSLMVDCSHGNSIKIIAVSLRWQNPWLLKSKMAIAQLLV